MKHLMSKKWLRRMLIFLVVIYGGDWCLTSILASRNQTKIDRFLSQASSSSLLQLFDQELDSTFESSGNGWYLVMGAISLYPDELRDLNDEIEWSPDQISLRESSLNQLHFSLELARTCDRITPVLNYGDPVTMLLPHLFKIRGTVRGLVDSAHWNFEQKNSDRAIQRLKDALELTDFATKEPIIVSLLVQIACDNLVYECLESRAADMLGSELDSLRTLLTNKHERTKAHKALQGEVLYGLYAYEQLASGKMDVDYIDIDTAIPWIRLIPLAKSWLEWDKSVYIDLLLPAMDGSITLEDWRNTDVRQCQEGSASWAPLTAMLLPAIHGVVDKTLEGEQRRLNVLKILAP